MKRNFYDLLGVDSSADEKKIKKAYKYLALRYHPDKFNLNNNNNNNNNNDINQTSTNSNQDFNQFMEIKEAYETLMDPLKKSRYDKQEILNSVILKHKSDFLPNSFTLSSNLSINSVNTTLNNSTNGTLNNSSSSYNAFKIGNIVGLGCINSNGSIINGSGSSGNCGVNNSALFNSIPPIPSSLSSSSETTNYNNNNNNNENNNENISNILTNSIISNFFEQKSMSTISYNNNNNNNNINNNKQPNQSTYLSNFNQIKSLYSVSINVKLGFFESQSGVSKKSISYNRTVQCNECSNSKKQKQIKCETCQGVNRIVENCEIQIDVPKGVTNGQKIIYSSLGNICDNLPILQQQQQQQSSTTKLNNSVNSFNNGSGNNNIVFGDLIVCFQVEESLNLKREGDDIISEVSLDFIDAILGCRIAVPILCGQMEIDIPEGTQPNQILKIKNQGFLNPTTMVKGNYYLKIIVLLPKKVSRSQVDLLSQFYKQ